MTITSIPYSYRSYAYHIRIREDQWNKCIMYMWGRYPDGDDPSAAYRTYASKLIVAVNDEQMAVEIALKFG